ncbi:beta-propeller fold lactonase family protein [Rhodohalobacter sp.]|uniref:beta-propeller fold lactonase family protein n=1 Tax=Rhodohalobacter sp. TaxID=1974210 RepID=UPI002ACD7371|nr:beta-propeller fold lactonase family protein [Rhodohalobacter sp.]MDZ7756535.1 beta-propeller fold lactonase family protein [Rhodohalobacter sp.]
MNRLSFLLLLSGLVSLLLLISTETMAQTGESPQYIYVCNQGSASVTVIDASTQTISETVDLQELGFSENAKPHHVVAEPDGSFWYVTLIGENSVLKFNRANELVGQAALEVPGLLALHPEDDLLFVGRSMSAVNPPQSFGVVNRSSMDVLDEIDLFFTRPHALTTSADGSWTFVGSLSENPILSYNLENDESNLTNVAGDTHVFVNFAVHPDGNTMVATGQISGQLLVFDISDPMNPKLTDMIETEAMPWHPVFSPDGKYVYFGNKQDHSVSVVNMETRTLEDVIRGEGLAQPHGAALSRDGKYLFISNNNLDGTYSPEGSSSENPVGTVTVINTETREIEKVIEVGHYPSGVGTNAW